MPGLGTPETPSRVMTHALSSPVNSDIRAVSWPTNLVLADISVGKEPDGVGVDWLTNRVYVSNYGSDTVTIIDGATNAVLKTIPVGDTPDGLTVDQLTGRVYISNSNSNSVSVIER